MKIQNRKLILLLISFCSFSISAQSNIEGVWSTGEYNTKIEISEIKGQIKGKIKSSENEKAEIDKVILKNLKINEDKWIGEIYSVKRKRWYNVVIIPHQEVLELKIGTGFSSKYLQWKKGK